MATDVAYLQLQPDPVFTITHRAVGSRADVAVVLCPPFGWEDMASYRGRREWAEDLAAAGITTLRLDLPGSGDSAGTPHDPGRVAAWLGAIDGAARHLRATQDVRRIAVLGIGLGGLLAVAAAAQGAPIDEVVSWGARASGRATLRELRAFSRLERGTTDELPEGAIVAAGYLMTAETAADLEQLDVTTLTSIEGPLDRVLVLDRDAAGDATLTRALTGLGLDVEECEASGYADLVSDWLHHSLPAVVREEVRRWLLQPPSRAARDIAEPAPAPETVAEMEPLPGVGERVVSGSGFFGVIAGPADGVTASATLVMLNAGLQRRTGPNRMWVEMARRFALRGITTVRLDVSALGDADGDPGRYAQEAGFYTDELVLEVRGILDHLPAAGLPDHFVLGGLCAGAFWSLHAAADDPRVCGALLLNTDVIVWGSTIRALRNLRVLRDKLLQPRSWSRALMGRSDYRTHLAALRTILSRRADTEDEGPGGPPADGPPHPLSGAAAEPVFERLGRKRTLFLFAGRQALHEELARQGLLARMDEWPGIEVMVIDAVGDTHTLRPRWLQARVHATLDDAVERLWPDLLPRSSG